MIIAGTILNINGVLPKLELNFESKENKELFDKIELYLKKEEMNFSLFCFCFLV